MLTPKSSRCGISKFVRKNIPFDGGQDTSGKWEVGMDIPTINWRAEGVAGGWDCVVNSDCDHLEGGEERGW